MESSHPSRLANHIGKHKGQTFRKNFRGKEDRLDGAAASRGPEASLNNRTGKEQPLVTKSVTRIRHRSHDDLVDVPNPGYSHGQGTGSRDNYNLVHGEASIQ